MIKVPATPEGIPAIRQLIAEGINVNVTLLFAQDAYERAAEAYIGGLEALVARGGDPAGVASVASFFVSRIDTAIDAQLDARLSNVGDAREQRLLQSLRGRVAIANAKLAFQRYQELFSSPRWRALAARGAQTQRLLWASTGTKNANYRDVRVRRGVDRARHRQHDAAPDPRGLPGSRASLARASPRTSTAPATRCARSPIPASHCKTTTDALLADGIQLFVDAFRKLLVAVERQSRGTGATRIERRSDRVLPPEFETAVKESLTDWQAHGKVRRLWARDPTLWTGRDEAQWLGWLGNHERSARAPAPVRGDPRGRAERRRLTRPAPRHGRVEPRP